MATSHPCCFYSNRSQRLVLLRCIGPQSFFHEKVLFPFEDWVFHCPGGSDVQIWSHGDQGVELLDSFEADAHFLEEVPGTEAVPTCESDGCSGETGGLVRGA